MGCLNSSRDPDFHSCFSRWLFGASRWLFFREASSGGAEPPSPISTGRYDAGVLTGYLVGAPYLVFGLVGLGLRLLALGFESIFPNGRRWGQAGEGLCADFFVRGAFGLLEKGPVRPPLYSAMEEAFKRPFG